MESQKRIPTGKVKRAAKYLATGVKVGGNYVNHYTNYALTGRSDKQKLHEKNAQDIFDSLSELKGGALKVAQMLSLDSNTLPQEYLQKFAEAQYKTPPLSYPLVVKTFKKSFKKEPLKIFDHFNKAAVNAASMGQVHKASKDGIDLAVKIQYPGVAESVQSDLKVAALVAKQLLKLNPVEIDHYLQEVQERLLEETDYLHELEQSVKLSKLCQEINGVHFPKYYPEWSSQNILTMEWLSGQHLNEYLSQDPDQSSRNRLGQALWDFYQFQIHHLNELHADPHPGNFIILENGDLGIIDFGCTKTLPESFYGTYFQLLDPDSFRIKHKRDKLFIELGFIYPDDTNEERQFFIDNITQSIELLGKPFYLDEFDFGNTSYFQEIHRMGEVLSKSPMIRQSTKARGSKHALYLNRTYFGLYNILHQLKAKIKTRNFIPQASLILSD